MYAREKDYLFGPAKGRCNTNQKNYALAVWATLEDFASLRIALFWKREITQVELVEEKR